MTWFGPVILGGIGIALLIAGVERLVKTVRHRAAVAGASALVLGLLATSVDLESTAAGIASAARPSPSSETACPDRKVRRRHGSPPGRAGRAARAARPSAAVAWACPAPRSADSAEDAAAAEAAAAAATTDAAGECNLRLATEDDIPLIRDAIQEAIRNVLG